MDIDKVKELYVGQEFKNYKVLSSFLGETKFQGGKSKQLQLKDWNRYFEWERNGFSFIITQIFDTPKEKIDGRSKGNNTKRNSLGIYSLTNEQGKLKGVYKIQLFNQVYIGSTTVGFRTRYIQHTSNSNKFSSHTHDLLERGASFEILWIADEKDTEAIIRQKENDYIEQYRNDGYDMLNSHVPVIISEKRTVYSKKKIKYKHIKIKEDDYEKAISLLNENGFEIAV